MRRLLFCCSLCVVLLNPPAIGQTSKDFVYRQNLGIILPVTKKTELGARYRFVMFDNATRFRRSMFSIEANQDLLKGLKAGVEYRYYTSYEMDYHRFQGYMRYNYKFGNYGLSYRLQYQQRQDYFDQEYLAFKPPLRVLRHRLQLKYDYNKKLAFYVFAEPFQRMEHGELSAYRIRYAAGTEYALKKRHAFNVELFFNDEFNLERPDDVLTLDVSYYYKFKKVIKSKKKKDDSEVLESLQE